MNVVHVDGVTLSLGALRTLPTSPLLMASAILRRHGPTGAASPSPTIRFDRGGSRSTADEYMTRGRLEPKYGLWVTIQDGMTSEGYQNL